MAGPEPRRTARKRHIFYPAPAAGTTDIFEDILTRPIVESLPDSAPDLHPALFSDSSSPFARIIPPSSLRTAALLPVGKRRFKGGILI